MDCAWCFQPLITPILGPILNPILTHALTLIHGPTHLAITRYWRRRLERINGAGIGASTGYDCINRFDNATAFQHIHRFAASSVRDGFETRWIRRPRHGLW